MRIHDRGAQIVTKYAIIHASSHASAMVQNDKHGPKEVTLKALCGPGDDLKPVIRVMLPEED